ncbi:heat shock factor 2-binding protein-like isoform X2 [Venturia canescens]|uniref:heat shock factor 2-binding protein-like isoform X2 n=1 Tax=Venturia canescens TaxID=32260 RepID=UPI001C9BCC6C|nr:heat shock factor 2-binding protein-like isoform X2 [Venturia canescens]
MKNNEDPSDPSEIGLYENGYDISPGISEREENSIETRKYRHNEIPATLKNTSHTMVSKSSPGAATKTESQTAFTLNVGAVMGNLVWRASCEPEVIKQWFTQQLYKKKVEEFVSIADRIIETFFKMYEEELPPYSTDEYQFAKGLLGTVANMAHIPEGRNFLIENKDGKSLIRNLVYFLPRIPMPLGVHLKKLLMVILWNMSVNKSVLSYFFDLQIGRVVAHCLDESSPEILKLTGFELLLSITYNLTDPKLLDDIFKYVSIEKVRRIADTGQDKEADLAQRFLDCLTGSGIAKP